MIPEAKEIGYECVNGHINSQHKSTPRDSGGFRPACVECSGKLKRTLIPLLECHGCGNVWAYTGDYNRPTCPDCAGKNTEPIGDG